MKQPEVGTFTTQLHGMPFVCSDDCAVGRVIKKGEYELSEIRTVSLATRPGDTFVDCGANVGIFTTMAAKLVGPTGKVHAFEPDPFNFSLLKTNITTNNLSWANIYNAAVGNRTEKKFLFQSPNNAGDHRTWNDTKEVRPTIPVDVMVLDDVLGHLPRIDVLKIDVQGDEMKVLMGAEQLINRSPGLCISIEYWPYGLTNNGSSPKELMDFLCSKCLTYIMFPQIIGGLQSATKEDVLGIFGHNDDQVLNLWCIRR